MRKNSKIYLTSNILINTESSLKFLKRKNYILNIYNLFQKTKTMKHHQNPISGIWNMNN